MTTLFLIKIPCPSSNIISNFSVGNITLCVVGELIVLCFIHHYASGVHDYNSRSVYTPIVMFNILQVHSLHLLMSHVIKPLPMDWTQEITWEAVVDDSCAMSQVEYNVTIIRDSDIVYTMIVISDNRIRVSDVYIYFNQVQATTFLLVLPEQRLDLVEGDQLLYFVRLWMLHQQYHCLSSLL